MVTYPEFKTGLARYNTFIIYRCQFADNLQDILVNLVLI